jgi:hypothetical protein
VAKFYTPGKISDNIRETPEGYLLCLGVPIARTGWQDYGEGETPLKTGPDGIVKIYRSPKEVFRPETIASFQGKSITIKHPENFVEPENWQELSHGTAQNVRKSDEKDEDGEESLIADLLITEKLAIELVKNGLREISCGYEAEYEQKGEGKGEQLNIIGNHIALVEEGRAGSSYAIRDHKGKVNMAEKTLIERLKAKLGAKVVDDAMAEEKKESKDAPTVSNESYDELKKMVGDISEKMSGLVEGLKEYGSKDDDEEKMEEKKEESKDDDAEQPAMEERMKALEAAVSKILEKMGKSQDDDEEEKEESKDDDFEESSMTGDAARAEVLAPGLKPAKGEKVDSLSFKRKVLKAAYATEDGKKILDLLNDNKKMTLDSVERVGTLFVAASELLAEKRGNGLEGTKHSLKFEKELSDTKDSGPMTAEKLNEINAAFYGGRK